MSNEDVGEYFRQEFRAQRKFVRRVRYKWMDDRNIVNIKAVKFFMDMMKRMSNAEKHFYFEDWLYMFREILGRYFRDEMISSLYLMGILELILCELLKTIDEVFPSEKSLKTDLFLRVCAKGVEMERRVCDGESDSDGWSFRKSCLLMQELKLSTKLLGETLIKYGLQYGYDREYYKLCCCKLRDNNLEINGIPFIGRFKETIFHNGSLRMQLGIEILLNLFCKTEKNYEGVLRCLWRAVPYPFITGEELFLMFKPYYEGSNPNLQDLCNEFMVGNHPIFPVPEKTEPRSLKVLCKIKIRNQLYKAEGINDEAINNLMLPRTLERYLKLEED